MPRNHQPKLQNHQSVLEFLGQTLPFADLPPSTVTTLAHNCAIDFVPQGTLLFKANETEVTALLLIQQGGVRLFIHDHTGVPILTDYRGEGDTLGGLALLRGSKATMNAETVEDTFFLAIPAKQFHQLLNANPTVAKHFIHRFSGEFLDRALESLRQSSFHSQAHTPLPLFTTRVEELVSRPLVGLPSHVPLWQGAEKMSREGVGALILYAETTPIGIVTDKDFRDKVVAQRLDGSAPVSTIMSAPVETVAPGTSSMDALVTMMHKHIHHLLVQDPEAKPVGLISSHDFMLLQGQSPFSLFKEIQQATHLSQLHGVAEKQTRLMASLFRQGAKITHLGHLNAALYDLLTERLLTLLQERLGPPPAPLCWMCMGSEGRLEQILPTDQDNCLVYGPVPQETLSEAPTYFREFGQAMVNALVDCGFPPCPGQMTAATEQWNRSLASWENAFTRWLREPSSTEIMLATIFFDLRPVVGHIALGEKLRGHIRSKVPREEIFLRHLAEDSLASRPPLTFFKQFVMEKNGEAKNRLDIKGRGLVPLIDGVRVLSLAAGIEGTNTVQRLENLQAQGTISEEFCSELTETFEFLTQIRTTHQLYQWEHGMDFDNWIAPEALTSLEKRTLKEAFTIIRRQQQFTRDRFRLRI
ncbi:MAG: putative nucleotidyltransferase substrate binding domain-containing protein [Thermodesulfobacteriota bacterium]